MVFAVLVVSQPASARLVFGPDAETEGDALDTIVAVVDDDVITRSELDDAIAIIVRQLEQQGTPIPPQDILQTQVLERLILAKLQLRAAERNSVVVDDTTVNAAMERLARSNNLTLAELRQAIEEDGVSFADFREQIREEILATRLRQRVVDSQIDISEQEVDSVFRNNPEVNQDNREYRIAHILIAVPEGASPEQIAAARDEAQEVLQRLEQGADFERLAVAVSDGRQALEGGDLGWRSAEQLPTLFTTTVPQLEVGQVSELIRSPSGFHIVKLLEVKGAPENLVTQTRIRHILIEEDQTASAEEIRQRLLQLKQRIEQGEDFGELAKAHSGDTTSAFKGGDLGWVNPQDLGPQFEEMLDPLQPGQVSAPFNTPYGWHLVQVLDRRQQQAGAEVQRDQIRNVLFQRRAEEEWELWLRRLRDEAYVEIRLAQPETPENLENEPEWVEQSARETETP